MPAKETKKTLEELKDEIIEESNEPGQYSHNLVSIRLRIIARDYGFAEANKAVRELDLTRIWGIHPIDKPGVATKADKARRKQ